jgi:hypothetical protein
MFVGYFRSTRPFLEVSDLNHQVLTEAGRLPSNSGETHRRLDWPRPGGLSGINCAENSGRRSLLS